MIITITIVPQSLEAESQETRWRGEIRVKIEAKLKCVVAWFIGNEFDQALCLLELALGGGAVVRQYLSANLCNFL